MMIGIVFSGVLAGLATATASVAVGHPIEMTILVYMTAGVLGSLMFVGFVARPQPDVRR